MKRLLVFFTITLISAAMLIHMARAAGDPAAASNPGSKVPRWRDNTGMVFVLGGELPRAGAAPLQARSFYMDERKASNAQFAQFLSDGNGRFWSAEQAIERNGDSFTPKPGTENDPILHATLEAARSYARWTGKRLPTPEELEWAAQRRSLAGPQLQAKDDAPLSDGFLCVRPARRVLVLVGENFEELELGAYTGILSWANHTKPAGDYMFKAGAAEVPNIEVVIAAFTPEVHGMGGMNLRPHVLVKDLKTDDLDRFDAVAIPAAVGGARGQHTWQGRADLESRAATSIVQQISRNGGFLSTMCAGSSTLSEAKLPVPKTSPDTPVALDSAGRTATSAGPGVAIEAACLLVQQLVTPEEYAAFRASNPWLFGGKDQYAPRMESLR